MQETSSDRHTDGNSDLDIEVNELMYGMMMDMNCITFIIASSTIVLIKFSDKVSSISNNMFREAKFRKYTWEQNC